MFQGLSDIGLKRAFYLYTIALLMAVTWCLILFAGEPLKLVGFSSSLTFAKGSHAQEALLSLAILFLALNLKIKASGED